LATVTENCIMGRDPGGKKLREGETSTRHSD
jgi:hypothetical protein